MKQLDSKKFVKSLSISESYISMAIGLVVVLLIGVFAFNYFTRERGKISLPGIQSPEISDQNGTRAGQVKNHTVSAGESLWKIAEKYYRSGYNWINIARANNITNPDKIEVGQSLEIPSAESIKPAITSVYGPAIASDSYTVEKADSLWKIASRAYNDPYSWTKIAKANALVNPNVIYPGTSLKIPR